jgi:hypothetical protein
MAINKYSTGNLHNFYYGATTASDNTVNLTDSDFGTTNEFYCVNAVPMIITVPANATLSGVAGGSITLNQGEYCKILSIAQNIWVYIDRKMAATSNTLGLVKQASVSPDSASAPGATYTQSEIQSLLKELRDLKAQLRNAGILAS